MALKLLEHKITCVGTMKSNRLHIPPVLKTNHQEINETVFVFRNNIMLASYRAKEKKTILMASTFHSQPDIPELDNPAKKPEVILEYNRTKAGVDAVDQLVASNSSRKNMIKRWPMVIFTMLVDVAAINAYAINTYFNRPTPSQTKSGHRRKYLEKLATSLIMPQVQRRAELYEAGALRNLHTPVVMAMRAVLERDLRPPPLFPARQPRVPANPPAVPAGAPTRRCHVCVVLAAQAQDKRKHQSTTTKVCSRCSKKVCKAHAINICRDCV